MPLTKIKWSPTATGRLADIYNFIYLREGSRTLAENQIDYLLSAINLLKKNKNLGTEEPLAKRYNKNHRIIIEGSYKIIYRVENDSVFIIDLFHTSRHPRKIKSS